MNRIVIINNTPNELEPFKALGLNTKCIDVKDFLKSEEQKVYFVSPANVQLFMDGGIDMAYLRMFSWGSNVRSFQYYLQEKMRTQKDTPNSLLGRKYLPIGAAMCNEVPNTDGQYYLICAPTMLFPQNVNSTQNAYYAMKATWNRSGLLVVPLLACGIGKMNLTEAANQIKRAIDENDGYEGNLYIPKNYISILNEQPKVYENTEFFNIPLSHIKYT
jgi:O-acetyl-ADP-ribose deacetylase (regulator of RNase III)